MSSFTPPRLLTNVWSGTTGIVLMLQRTSGIMLLCGIVVRANRLL